MLRMMQRGGTLRDHRHPEGRRRAGGKEGPGPRLPSGGLSACTVRLSAAIPAATPEPEEREGRGEAGRGGRQRQRGGSTTSGGPGVAGRSLCVTSRSGAGLAAAVCRGWAFLRSFTRVIRQHS